MAYRMEDQFVESKQGYIDNMNTVAVCGGNGVGEDVDVDDEILGVKCEEQLLEKNDVGDDDELKYVKEVQQSEKQHLVENVGDGSNSNELAEKENETQEYEVNIEEENMYNQKEYGDEVDININDNMKGDNDNNVFNQFDQVNEVTPQGVTYGVLDYKDQESVHDTQELKGIDSEEMSSQIINDTTKDSSHSIQALDVAAFEKENILDFHTNAEIGQNADTKECLNIQHADFETASSQLNPEAKEFVPFIESNLMASLSGGDVNTVEDKVSQVYAAMVPSALPRYMVSEDDFVAQSPRKGRGDDMETIAVPAVQEFEEEADQRPHELETDIQAKTGEENIKTDNFSQDSLINFINGQESQTNFNINIDSKMSEDIDHSSVIFNNTDTGFHGQLHEKLSENNDLMKQSIYLTSGEAIESVLNSVQPIPTEIDSVNSSFNEEFTDELLKSISLGEKELLQVEEKEHISKSPSTEEIPTNINVTTENAADKLISDMEDNICQLETLQFKESEDINKAYSEEILADKKIVNIENEHHTFNSSSAEEKYLIEKTKEQKIHIHNTTIDQLMSEMDICDDRLNTQINEILEEPFTKNNAESPIDKCDANILTVKDFFNNENEIMEDVQHGPQVEKNFLQHEDNSKDTICEIGYNIENVGILPIGETKNEDLFTVGNSSALQVDQFTNEKAIADYVDDTTQPQLAHLENKGINSESELLFEKSCNREEKARGTSNLISEDINQRNEEAPQPNLVDNKILSADKDESVETSLKGISIEKLAETSSSEPKSLIPLEIPAQLEAPNANVGKKIINKNSVKMIQTKTSTSVQSLSKKISETESVKKPVNILSKTKLTAVKSSTTTSSTDRKQTKTSSITTNPIRKTAVTTSAAAKVPPKGNVTARSAHITTTTLKSTTSKPLAPSRSATSAPTSRKPVASVISSTAKTLSRPLSADTGKQNILEATEPGTVKPKAPSPRATLTSQIRKTGQVTTTKSPAKTTITSTTAKTTAVSFGLRAKPTSSIASNGATGTTKPNNSRPAAKSSSTTNTTSRRLPAGTSTVGAVTANSNTKLTNARKSSPIKTSTNKTPTKITTSSTNSNTKSVIKPASVKQTEKKLTKQGDVNGVNASIKTNISTTTNSISKIIPVKHQQSGIDKTEPDEPRSNGNEPTVSEKISDCMIAPLQEDLIGANDH